ncbi:MAG TPA: hypothetical protein VHP33_14710 [Polyangiaceae bacterium]|nr:hypothetical protein [Polyangiaceae bacterium]
MDSSRGGAGGPVAAGGSVAIGGSATGTAGSTATGGGSGAEQAGSAGASGSGVAGSGPAGPCDLSGAPNAPVSKWASPNADGTLSYAKLPDGSHIPDYSHAGYMGGGVAFPSPPIVSTIEPSGGEDAAVIQKALDTAASLPINAGLRGVVLLAAGTYNVSSTLNIRASGVVLRGRGSGSGGTVMRVGGAPHTAIVISGSGDRSRAGEATTITDAYVAAGARSFRVEASGGFKVGDTVLVQRPVTSAWIEFMGMDNMVRNGKRQTWIGAGSVIESDRIIAGIAGNEVTLDAPLADSLDQKYLSPPGPKLVRYTFNGRIEQVGVEGIRLVAPKQAAGNASPQFTGVRLDAVQNGFVRDVVIEEFGFGMSVGDKSKWITIQDSAVLRTTPVDNSAGYPFQFAVTGQLTLLMNCRTSGEDAFAYVTQARVPGPNVVLGLTSNDGGSISPHQRWATGLLVDSSTISGGIDMMNRGYLGSGHGWTMGFGTVWNSTAASFLVQLPPGAPNWAIGSSGTIEKRGAPGLPGGDVPNGIYDSHGKSVAPASLYRAQLCGRLGPKALSNIDANSTIPQ